MTVSAKDVERTLRNIFKRCVQCPATTPSCPQCPSGQVCSEIPQSCTACASMTCIKNAATSSSASSGPNVGAIAGGVVGGVAFVAIATFLVWWFFIKDKRLQNTELWEDDDLAAAKSQFREQRDARASVHTVQSVASTMLSRASNFIPIAFIPGVTNRDQPPVPPIPAARPGQLSARTSNNRQDALFFMPGDLRNSTYSTTSTLDNRKTFIGRPSITPSLARSSMASYRDDATVNPMPAQTVTRVRPNMVSVKSGATTPNPISSPGSATPAMILEPTTYSASNSKPATNASSGAGINGLSPSGSVHSSSTASYVKPVPVTIGKNPATNGKNPKGRFPVRSVSGAPDSEVPTLIDVGVEEGESGRSIRDSATTIQESPAVAQTPLTDITARHANPQHSPRLQDRGAMSGLSAVIEEATMRASRVPRHIGLGGQERGDSPFGDEHASE